MCTNQDAAVVMQAATAQLPQCIERKVYRSGARIVVEFDSVVTVLKALTGDRNSGCIQFEEKDNQAAVAAPIKIAHSFVSGVTSITGRPAKGKTLGGGQQRQTKSAAKRPSKQQSIQSAIVEDENPIVSDANLEGANPPQKKRRVMVKVRELPQ